MTINRDNYEEYFLLYTDNELSVQEKLTVEEFVQQNPDLQSELVMLQETVLQPDNVVFDNKGSLLNHPIATGTILQEKLLLLLDEELNQEELGNITAAIQSDAEIAKEWQLLQQTKLSAKDIIVFENKEVLYKKEKGKVIAIRFWKIAAAAVLIGAGLWGTIAYFNGTKTGSGAEGFAVNPGVKSSVKDAAKNAEQDQQSLIDSSVVPAEIVVNNLDQSASAVPNDKTKAVNNAGGDKKLTGDDMVIKDAITPKEKSNNLPTPVLEKINTDSGNNNVIASVTQSNKDEIKPLDNASLNEAAQPYAINTAFADNKDDKITYGFDEEEQPKKTKVGGFFKKLNRVLQRKANIKTGSGDSFKVANLSFAVQ